jgi:hypothetical protein
VFKTDHRAKSNESVSLVLDETGGTLGPLLIALILYRNGSYRTGYTVLLISSLVALTVARVVFPVPSRLEPGRSFDGTGQRIHARVLVLHARGGLLRRWFHEL